MKNYVGSERALLKTPAMSARLVRLPVYIHICSDNKKNVYWRLRPRWVLNSGINKYGWINSTFLGTTLQKNVQALQPVWVLPSPWLRGHTRWAPAWRSCQWGWAAELQLSGPSRCSHVPALARVSWSGNQPERRNSKTICCIKSLVRKFQSWSEQSCLVNKYINKNEKDSCLNSTLL